MPVRHVVFDFDGTCTEIPAIVDAYHAGYRAGFSAQVSATTQAEWDAAKAQVEAVSPKAAWMFGGAPSAPAAADPFILAGETAALLMRQRNLKTPLPNLHSGPYDSAQAKWRGDVAHVLQALAEEGKQVWFVSNSDTMKIEHRLDDLLRAVPSVRAQIHVVGDAQKFALQELPFDSALPEDRQTAFRSLPAADAGPERPVYLRRGRYFDALCRALGNDGFEETLVCGDIWELDLAMPAMLGCSVHLITRQAPFQTYDYERQAVAALGDRGGIGDELSSLLGRL